MIPAAKADKKQEVLNKSVQSSITFDDETSISIKPKQLASFGSQNKTTHPRVKGIKSEILTNFTLIKLGHDCAVICHPGFPDRRSNEILIFSLQSCSI